MEHIMTNPKTLSELVPAATLAKALLEAEEKLDRISLMVSYINSQTVFATMTEKTDGPKAIMPLPQEAWDVLMSVGKVSHEALAQIQRIKKGEMV